MLIQFPGFLIKEKTKLYSMISSKQNLIILRKRFGSMKCYLIELTVSNVIMNFIYANDNECYHHFESCLYLYDCGFCNWRLNSRQRDL